MAYRFVHMHRIGARVRVLHVLSVPVCRPRMSAFPHLLTYLLGVSTHPRAQTPAYGHFDNSVYEHVGEKVSVRRCKYPGWTSRIGFFNSDRPRCLSVVDRTHSTLLPPFLRAPLLPLLAAGFNAQPVRLFDVHIRATVYTTLRVFFSSWVCL